MTENEKIKTQAEKLKGNDGIVRKILVGKCFHRSITSKANGVAAVRCMHPSAVSEGSIFETCIDPDLDADQCFKNER